MDEILIKAKSDTAIQSYTIKRELSSVGSEHLPYKQRVDGSNPSVPTKKRRLYQKQKEINHQDHKGFTQSSQISGIHFFSFVAFVQTL